MLSHSVVSNSLWSLWTVARQAPLSMWFSRQEYWSGLPCPPPGDLIDPELKSMLYSNFLSLYLIPPRIALYSHPVLSPLDYDSFIDFPWFWWSLQFWGRLLPSTEIYVMFLSWLNWGLGKEEGDIFIAIISKMHIMNMEVTRYRPWR